MHSLKINDRNLDFSSKISLAAYQRRREIEVVACLKRILLVQNSDSFALALPHETKIAFSSAQRETHVVLSAS